ncbi:BON domain-containing protein [Paludibacterium purpuratum]|uniref:BON domain-containing protein n=1 Tax=Paludibacterium purpuratum TaxID=1144873 RepID=A0A4R7BAJ8_9NEIS|nr:BON domain-containing protein [Paludibacterium purpuratum]TDR81970.1 BON domain-containing protein [Paludibacterium purpuratum]
MKYHAIRNGILPLLICTVCIAPLAACDRQSTPEPPSEGSVHTPADDTALTARVKTVLAGDAGLSTIKLSVDSENGIVTICGRVPDQATLDTVSRLAAGVAGVIHVNNHVSVGP